MPFDPSTYAGSSFELIFPEQLFGAITPDAIDFIRALLQIDPQRRPTAAKAMAHPWLTTSAALPTPLLTPRHLGILKRSGNMEGKFSHATDIWLYSCATTPVPALDGLRRPRQHSNGSREAGQERDLVLSEVRFGLRRARYFCATRA